MQNIDYERVLVGGGGLKYSFGFTLAEILVTLGIIGIVISMTLPPIILNYKRHIIETRLAKFYSIMNQALLRSVEEHGDIPFKTFETNDNSEYLIKWYDEYIIKYISTIEKKELNPTYIKYIFNDGSGFGSALLANSNTLTIFYLINPSKDISFDGINGFAFVYNPETKQVETFWQHSSYKMKKSLCYNPKQRNSCSALIQANGWKIPKDYPWVK